MNMKLDAVRSVIYPVHGDTRLCTAHTRLKSVNRPLPNDRFCIHVKASNIGTRATWGAMLPRDVCRGDARLAEGQAQKNGNFQAWRVRHSLRYLNK